MPRTKNSEPKTPTKSTPVKKVAEKKSSAPTKTPRLTPKQKNEALKIKLQALLDEI